MANCGGRFGRFSYQELRKRDKRSIRFRTYPASLDTLKVSVPPAVKLAAVAHARPALDPDIIAAEIVEDLEAALSQFALISADLKK